MGDLTPQGGAVGDSITPGQVLRDRSGGWFRVYDIGGGQLRLAPFDPETSRLLAPRSQWQRIPAGGAMYETTLGQLIEINPSGGIIGDPRTIPWGSWAGDGGTGSTAWSSTQAAQTQADAAAMERLRAQIAQDQADLAESKRQFDIAQANDDRRLMQQIQAQIDLEELRIENSKRELLYSEIGASTRTVFQAQEAERGRQQEMAGEDPFRFTGTLRGRGTAGQTPTDIFKQQGAAFANQPLPQFSINDPIPTLEAGLQGLQKLSVAGAPQGLIPGMAQGGTVGQGPFGVVPAWVGEDGPELALLAPGSSIVPLDQIAGAQGGINIPGLDFGGFPDLLESLRRSTGLTGPQFSPFADPWDRSNPWSTAGVLPQSVASRMGAFQMAPGTLARAEGAKPVYMVDEQGRLRPFGSREAFEGAGHEWGDIQEFDPASLGRIGRGPAIMTGEDYQLPPPNYEGAFGALGQPLSVRQGLLELAAVNPNFSDQEAKVLANQIGFLPAPHKIAREFMLLDPTEQQGIMSLYNLAGFPTASFNRIIGAATPQAGAFGGRRIGFTGGFMG